MVNVTVYTKNGCPQCDMTKNVLNGNGVEFEQFNVEEDEQAMTFVKDVLKLSSMPVVIIEGQEPFTGFRPDKLHAIQQ